MGRADIRSFLERVNVKVDPELEKELNRGDGLSRWGAAKVAIKLKDGRDFSEKRHTTKGYPEMPMQWDELVEKYRECADYAGVAQKGIKVEESIGLLKQIEGLDNIRQLVQSLTPR